jgi:hypothetical protein
MPRSTNRKAAGKEKIKLKRYEFICGPGKVTVRKGLRVELIGNTWRLYGKYKGRSVSKFIKEEESLRWR